MEKSSVSHQARVGICSLCQRTISIDSKTATKLEEQSVGAGAEMVCEPCARKLGLGDELYVINAGYLFQRFQTFRLKLWAVGTFHL